MWSAEEARRRFRTSPRRFDIRRICSRIHSTLLRIFLRTPLPPYRPTKRIYAVGFRHPFLLLSIYASCGYTSTTSAGTLSKHSNSIRNPRLNPSMTSNVSIVGEQGAFPALMQAQKRKRLPRAAIACNMCRIRKSRVSARGLEVTRRSPPRSYRALSTWCRE